MPSVVTTPRPLVSVGMPVYNAERYLSLALDALLAQDFRDFELIVSDNASTDATERICREYAAGDAHVRYVRNEENIGAYPNFDRVFEFASGEYFMWAAHDDLWEPTFLGECVAALARHPEAVGCCTDVVLIDEEGKPYQPPDEEGARTFDSTAMSVRRRASALLSRTANYAIYGLMRADALRQTHPFEEIPASDIVRLLELNLLGPFIKVPKPLFLYRVFASRKVEDVLRSFDPDDGSAPVRPLYTPTVAALLRAVRRSRLGGWRRTALSLDVLVSFCLRNSAMRGLMGAEGVARLRRSYRRRDLKEMLSAAPFCPLVIPDKLFFLRESNERQLVDSYRRRDVWTFSRRLPLYLLLSPGKLARREAWSAVSRLFKKSPKTVAP